MNPPFSMRSFLGLVLCCGAAIPLAAEPVTITFSAQQPGSGLAHADGIELPAESSVRFGYFSIPFEQVVAGIGTPSLLESSFIELAATRIGYFGGSTVLDESGNVFSNSEPPSPWEGAPGLFGHTLTYDPAAMGLMATRYFLWVSDTPDAGSATEFGLFSDADWTSPAFGEATYDVSTVNPANPLDLYAADRGPEVSTIPAFGALNKLRTIEGIPVPEPHLPALLLLAGGLLGCRRRRANSLES